MIEIPRNFEDKNEQYHIFKRIHNRHTFLVAVFDLLDLLFETKYRK